MHDTSQTGNLKSGEVTEKTNSTQLASATADELAPLRAEQFKKPLEDMEILLSQSRRAFLLGAGCSKCVGLPLMDELTTHVLKALPNEGKADQILSSLQDNFGADSTCNIEDLMSEIVDWISIADRRKRRGATNSSISLDTTTYNVSELKETLSEIKEAICKTIAQSEGGNAPHRCFMRAIHRTLQTGKARPIHPVDYFILNYDMLIEDALGMEKIPFADGFSGGATGWWARDQYLDSNVYARVFKVHGSIDWCLWENDVYPSRLRPSLIPDGNPSPFLIWPAATKFREAQRDPFAQILALMRESLRPMKSSEVVLAIIGYGFGDEHINVEIEQALHESDERLTVLVFTSDDEPTETLAQWLKDPHIQDQVRVYANRGFFHGQKQHQSSEDLIWWKFEVLGRLLEGQR